MAYNDIHNHRGEALLIIGNVTIGAGKASGAGCVSETTMILDCASSYNRYTAPVKYSFNHAEMVSFDAFLPSKPGKIEIDWPNSQAPVVHGDFFAAVVDWMEANGGGHLTIACQGGHGRTGTALAAILIKKHNMSAAAAIDWVRRNYCNKAIETASQVDWLCRYAGRGETTATTKNPALLVSEGGV